MPKYVIERDFPGAGNLSHKELQEISIKSCDVLKGMDTAKIQWLESYVTDDKIYCIYIAENEALLKQHAQGGGFPITKVSRVNEVIDPATSEVLTHA
mgnify:CR=1 FL=1